MHELAITESILKIAVNEAEKHNALKVLKIRIKVGELSGVVPNLIQEYFNIVSRDTIASSAELVIDRVPITIKCMDCQREFKLDKFRLRCPECDGINIKILTGREFYVDSLEVE